MKKFNFLHLFLLGTLVFSNLSLQAQEILTPAPAPSPRINGPSIFGVRPGSPFLYLIPATGTRPMTFTAENLPKGLLLDAQSGRITGLLDAKGTHNVTLHAKNSLGESSKKFRIVCGDGIALTPPMGWNSWNCWGGEVSQEKVLGSAKAMAEKLRDHGWTYVNIDDGWQGKRGGPSNAIQPNGKFPDMKALSDEIHTLGLRLGIYSAPWKGTYQGHIGSYGENAEGTYSWIESGDHNENFRIGSDPKTWDQKRRTNWNLSTFSFVKNDVSQWEAWGVDYLKYDWHPNDVPHAEAMANALGEAKRDVVYSLSNSAPFTQAADWSRLANLWRTTGDITDTWQSMSAIGFNQGKWAPFQHPGHYNDPDMLVVGRVGWGNPHPTKLTPDEQYTHISLWCLLSAPLLIGCDLEKVDNFTLNLLTNDEVLEIDQDPLCVPAQEIARQGECRVYAKPLGDGSVAVGLFNLGSESSQVSAKWEDLKISSSQRVRDLWRQKDLGFFTGAFSSEVKPHGAVLIRLFPEKSPAVR